VAMLNSRFRRGRCGAGKFFIRCRFAPTRAAIPARACRAARAL
jgi:hypothetical protein